MMMRNSRSFSSASLLLRDSSPMRNSSEENEVRKQCVYSKGLSNFGFEHLFIWSGATTGGLEGFLPLDASIKIEEKLTEHD